mmetsp:Transcript_1824/g.3251  ORF Transcript_1824/g.3251 Transcript_1824/m.3251 type:complete len:106 (+) Transcript_1824:1975-2292(+)
MHEIVQQSFFPPICTEHQPLFVATVRTSDLLLSFEWFDDCISNGHISHCFLLFCAQQQPHFMGTVQNFKNTSNLYSYLENGLMTIYQVALRFLFFVQKQPHTWAL